MPLNVITLAFVNGKNNGFTSKWLTRKAHFCLFSRFCPLYYVPGAFYDFYDFLCNKQPFRNCKLALRENLARLLRICPDLIAESLCVIFNCLISPGIFPDEWKCRKVIPLFKQGDRRDVNNYRQISIIPVTAKVFERTVLYSSPGYCYSWHCNKVRMGSQYDLPQATKSLYENPIPRPALSRNNLSS